MQNQQMMQSRIRKHYYLDDYVLIAPKKAQRPRAFVKNTSHSDESAKDCPFCDCKENTLFRYHDHECDICVVQNIFPALSHDNPQAYGTQEVIIESDHHVVHFDELSPESIQSVLKTYQQRISELGKDPQIKYVVVFKNNGYSAASTMPHIHSQVAALPLVPSSIRTEALSLQQYADLHGTCALCEVVESELESNERVVIETNEISVIAPYASRSPYELWIIPNRHVASFSDLDEQQLVEVANALRRVVGFLHAKEIDYNFFVHDVPALPSHTMLQIMPRPNIWGGLELGTGLVINPVAPEQATLEYKEFLRNSLSDTEKN